MGKNGSGLHSSSSVFWDNTSDGIQKTLKNTDYFFYIFKKSA